MILEWNVGNIDQSQRYFSGGTWAFNWSGIISTADLSEIIFSTRKRDADFVISQRTTNFKPKRTMLFKISGR